MKTINFILILAIGSLLFACGNSPSTTSTETSEKLAEVPAESSVNAAPSKEQAEVAPSPTPGGHSSESAYGIDLSKFQGDEIDYLDKQKDSLSFIFCKATEGITYTDPDFSRNWKTIPQKGFIRGAYHFYRTADAPQAQADHCLEAIADLKDTDLPPVVDFEGAGIDQSQSVANIQKGLLRFLKLIKENTNRMPMIYTDIPSGNKYLNDPKFAEYALWIALYEKLEQPRLPDAWKGKRWVLWQKSSSYEIGSKKNDFDVFNGNVKSLRSFIKNY